MITGLTSRPVSSRHSVTRTYDEIAFEVSARPSAPPDFETIPPGEYSPKDEIAFLFGTETSLESTLGNGESRHALAQIENDLTNWCINNGKLSFLLFHRRTRH